MALQLLERSDVELCHPEIVREPRPRGAAPPQWHLQPAVIGGRNVEAHANVVAAWDVTQGDGVVICVLDDGVDIDHEEFARGRPAAGGTTPPTPSTSRSSPSPTTPGWPSTTPFPRAVMGSGV